MPRPRTLKLLRQVAQRVKRSSGAVKTQSYGRFPRILPLCWNLSHPSGSMRSER